MNEFTMNDGTVLKIGDRYKELTVKEISADGKSATAADKNRVKHTIKATGEIIMWAAKYSK